MFQAMSVALRYRLPIRIDAGAVAECNRDFLDRMLLNPSGECLVCRRYQSEHLKVQGGYNIQQVKYHKLARKAVTILVETVSL